MTDIPDVKESAETLNELAAKAYAAKRKERPRALRSRPPGKRTITREKYDEMVEAFRTYGENFKAVAEKCHVHWSTARRAWRKGWNDQKSKPWAIAISARLEQDKIAARAALEREKNALVNDHRIARQDQLREAIEAGFADLVDSRRKQGKVIRAARDNSIAALIVSQKMLKAAIPLADVIAQQLQNSELTVHQRLNLMRQIVRFSHDAVEIAQIADEMERKALGEPDTILQVQHGVSMDLNEAKATLAEVASVLEDFQNSDELEVTDTIDVDWSQRDNATLEVKSDIDTGTDNEHRK